MSGWRREDGAETSHHVGGKMDGWTSGWMIDGEIQMDREK